MERLTFTKADHLRQRREFHEVQTRGRKFHTAHFVMIVLEREGLPTRLGITVTRKIGNAVQRNRVKRLVREVFRLHRGHFPPRHDVVVIAKGGAPELSFQSVLSEISEFGHRIRKYSSSAPPPRDGKP